MPLASLSSERLYHWVACILVYLRYMFIEACFALVIECYYFLFTISILLIAGTTITAPGSVAIRFPIVINTNSGSA